MRRRQFLKTVGTGLLGAGVLSGSAVAAHYDAQPEHVTLTYDEPFLKAYRPELVMPPDAAEKFLGLYGWVATSPEYDTDVCVYWCEYSHQEGWVGNLDSHYGDHEPIAVEVDSETGDVTRVRASVYHWIKGEGPASEVSINGTHPHLRVIEPWHQFTAADSEGELFAVDNLDSVYQSWLDNGLESSLEPGANTNPWVMQERPDWWQRGATGVSRSALLLNALQTAGVGDTGSLED